MSGLRDEIKIDISLLSMGQGMYLVLGILGKGLGMVEDGWMEGGDEEEEGKTKTKE